MEDRFRYPLFLLIGSICIAAVGERVPQWLSDENPFLRDFMDHDFLSFMGIILTLSLGFVVQIRFIINRLKPLLGQRAVDTVAYELRSTVRFLVGIFGSSFLIALTKPVFATTAVLEAWFNGIGIILILFFFLIVYDIVMALVDLDAPDENKGPE